MDVAHPIRGIIPGLEAAVLEVLAGTTMPLSGREIERLSGEGSHRGVQLVLRRLVTQGVALAEPRGNAVYYTANREHLAWEAIEALTGLRGALRDRLAAAIGSWRQAARHASLYGSAARGDGDATSDIDILLVRPAKVTQESEPWETQVTELREQATAWTGNAVQIFDIDEARLAEHVAARDPLVAGWLADGELLAGTALGILIANLPRPSWKGDAASAKRGRASR